MPSTASPYSSITAATKRSSTSRSCSFSAASANTAMPQWYGRVCGEPLGEFLAYVWRTGTPSPQVGHWQTKDGGRRLIAWSNRPLAGDDGTQAALVTTGMDLTDRTPQHEQERDLALQGDPGAKLVE